MSVASVSIQFVENMLPKELLDLLQPFQVDQIKNMISSFLVMNFSVHEYDCPKCGVHHPVLIKADKANSRKKMYCCKHCNKRFVVDHGQLTYYSHQSEQKWNQLIDDTVAGDSLKTSADHISIARRPHFACVISFCTSSSKCPFPCELAKPTKIDEKYFNKSHKGKKIEDVPGKKRGTPSQKRGISTDKVCLITGIERDGSCFMLALNMEHPSIEDIKSYSQYVA